MRLLVFLLAFGLFIFMPFAFSSRLQDVEQSPRFLVMAVMVAAAGVTAAVQLFYKRKEPVHISRSLFSPLLIVWLAVCVLASFRSINPGDGLFELLKTGLFVSLYFLLLLAFRNSESNQKLLFRMITVSSLVFILIGINQFYPQFLKSIESGKALKIDYSITSSLGNKNFFAELLLLMLPFSVLTLISGTRFWKVTAVVAIALTVIILLLLQTLSTWVGIAAGFMMVSVVFYRKRNLFSAVRNAGRQIRWVVAGTVICLVVGSLVFFKVTDLSLLEKRYNDFKELLSGTEETDNARARSSFRERTILWGNALRLSADYPVAGTGLANMKIIAPEYGLGSARYMADAVIRYNHPHNEFLFVLGETGIIGLSVYLALFILLFLYAWKAAARSETTGGLLSGAAFLFFMSALLIISLVSIPSTRYYPTILMMIAAAVLVSGQPQKMMIKKSWSVAFLLSTLLLSIYSIPLASDRLKYDSRLSQALLQERKKNPEGMRRILSDINREKFPLDATATPIAWYLGYSEFYLGNQQRAFELFKEAEACNPYHLKVINDLASCYNLSGDAETATQLYHKALAIQPNFIDALVNFSVIQYNSGNLDSAYYYLMKYPGRSKKEWIPIYGTIISAKAATLTSDTLVLRQFTDSIQNKWKQPKFVSQIRNHRNGLKGVLDDWRP